MVEKYFGGTLPADREPAEIDNELINTVLALRKKRMNILI